MGDLYDLTDIVVNAMHQFNFYGISLWFVWRTFSFTTIVVFPVTWFFISALGGTSTND